MASKKKKSLADQILELSNPAPKDWDPESVGLTSSWKPVADEDEVDESTQKPRGVGKSLRDISLTEGKYAGKPSSRKELYDEQSEDDQDEDEDAEEEENGEENGVDEEDELDEDEDETPAPKKQAPKPVPNKKAASKKIDSLFKGLEFDSENEDEMDFGMDDDEEMDEDQQEGADEQDDDDEEADDFDEDEGVDIVQNKQANPYAVSSSAMDEAERMMQQLEEEQKISVVARKSTDVDELSKARDTKNQKMLLDYFMDTRIRIQRAVQIANRLPQHDDYPLFVKDADVKSRYDEAYLAAEGLLFDLIQLKDDLFKSNPVVEKAVDSVSASKKRKVPETPTGHSVEDWWEVVSAYDESFDPYMEETINKWNSRVQLASGQHAGKQFKVLNQSVMTQVKNLLADKDRNRKKAQLKRSQFSVIGKPEAQAGEKQAQPNAHLNEYDEEIYDDTDFYQGLLKEIIEGSGQDVDARYILETHKLRKKQKNRKHDASNNKDRRIKYVTHDKLIGFMAPQINIQKQKARTNDSTALRLWTSDDFNLALFGQIVKAQ